MDEKVRGAGNQALFSIGAIFVPLQAYAREQIGGISYFGL